MVSEGYCDLHAHTHKSSALSQWSPEAVILRAKSLGIEHIALADRDVLNLDYKRQSEKYEIDVISACEFSASEVIDGKIVHVSVLGYRIDPISFEVQRWVRVNRKSRYNYLNAILNGLEKEGIHFTLGELERRNPKSLRIGRVHIGQLLIERGYVRNMDEAFQKYLGRESGSPAYVPSEHYLNFAPLDRMVHGIIVSGGLPILAHVPEYGLNEIQQGELLTKYKQYARKWACMETESPRYSQETIFQLKELAKAYGITESVGSDFQGYIGSDFVQGSPETYRNIQELWEKEHLGREI